MFVQRDELEWMIIAIRSIKYSGWSTKGRDRKIFVYYEDESMFCTAAAHPVKCDKVELKNNWKSMASF